MVKRFGLGNYKMRLEIAMDSIVLAGLVYAKSQARSDRIVVKDGHTLY